MRNRLFVVSVAGLVMLAVAFASAQQKMATYQLLILKKGPNAAKMATPEGQELLKAHVKHLYKMAADGPLKAAGPFTDGGDIQGIGFIAAASPEAAIALEADDPAVKAGLFTAEAMPFMSPEGWFGTWAAYPNFETVYFGFLKNGPDRSQDAETAKQLQAQHLAYMDGQHKEGKLPVAGPFMTAGGVHRGIVVYRVADMKEAAERANGDPMIKAGRLVVELHPWQVPLGALPK